MAQLNVGVFLLLSIGIMTSFGEAGATFSARPYFPLRAGASWSYISDDGTPFTSTVQPNTVTLNGVTTWVVQSSAGSATDYFSNDGNGIRLHRQFVPGVTATYSPPVPLAAATTDIGQTVNSSGSVSAGSGSFTYTSSYKVEASEIVTVPAGTIPTLRVRGTIRICAGTTCCTADSTLYVAKYIGLVKESSFDDCGDPSYVYELTGTNVHLPVASAPDFDSDGKSDVTIYRAGAWLAQDAVTGALKKAVWTGGLPGEIPTPGDYDGDGVTDLSSYRNGGWLFFDNTTGALIRAVWTGGVTGDIPVPGDYDGDGKTDIGIYRGGAWLIYDAFTGALKKSVWTGAVAGEIPTPGDYDGDGITDLSSYRNGAWLIFNNTNGAMVRGIWTGGGAGDIPVAGDYDGDAKTDIGIYRGGAWIVHDNVTGAVKKAVWTGAVAGEKPTPGDYDGDGITDLASYRNGAWLIFNNTNGALVRGIWTGGGSGDIPVSAKVPVP